MPADNGNNNPIAIDFAATQVAAMTDDKSGSTANVGHTILDQNGQSLGQAQQNPPVIPTVGDDKDKKVEGAVDTGKTDEGKKEEGDTKDSPGKEEMFLSDTGDLVNSKGEVIRKQGTFDFDEKTGQVSYSESGMSDLVSFYRENGLNFKDETGKELAFDDTIEGHFQLSQMAAKALAEQSLAETFVNLPDLRDFYLHLKAGGLAGDFYKLRSENINYNNVVVPKEDEGGRKQVILDWLTKVNKNDEATARDMMNYISDASKVDETYDKALTALKQWQVKTEEDYRKTNEQKISAEKERQDNLIKEMSTLVQTGDLGIINIPLDQRKTFEEYLFKPIEGKKTQADINYGKLSQKDLLVIDYLVFKGLKLDDFIAAKAQTLQANKLLKKVTIVPTVNSNPNFNKADSNNRNIEDYSLNKLN